MSPLRRRITESDLKDKGLPFECANCGNKPTAHSVTEHAGSCEVCGDEIIAYTVDTAEWISAALDRERELLAALKRLVEVGSDPYRFEEEIGDADAQVRAAIAKCEEERQRTKDYALTEADMADLAAAREADFGELEKERMLNGRYYATLLAEAAVWARIGARMGFIPETAAWTPGRPVNIITAEPVQGVKREEGGA